MEDCRQPDEDATEANKAALFHRVEQALRSSDLDTILEGRVARAVEDDLVDFNRKVEPDGSIGEVDVETQNALIEVTTRRSGKSKQIRKLLANSDMNPARKPVILFAPNYGAHATTNITSTGAIVVCTEEELLEVLATLEEKK
ncbi:MAG: hypothetical protein ETSY2_09585 [Candidatus Entotheonella gemina]|uniref:Restriction endonuclease type IV Mrr domain-containing protein n=1 Tax=Candidatus Entotheonella gemina TaxID=1429439 RepID=W4MBZ4_9BACT|nr:MAG: hypothetical protein ETSY2_09585 [Candidatus Entotheonella gemina]